MFTSFETSVRALRAHQRALDVTSNNIANVNTPGYTRQSALLAETDPFVTPHGTFGTGVFAGGVQQFREIWLDREMRNSLSRQSGYTLDTKIFQQLQTVMNEPSDLGLDSAMDKFYHAVEELTNKPDDIGLRSNLLSQASNLASTFNSTSTGLFDLRMQVYNQMDSNLTQVNRLLTSIADLNTSIVNTRSTEGELSGTLLDKQNLLLEQLSKYGDVHIGRSDLGIATVSMNGSTVVVNDTAMQLKVQQNIDSLTGEVTAYINVQDKNGTVLGSYRPGSGEVASQMKFFNVTLDDKDSSGGFSLARNLDTLAATFANNVNALSQTGYGLDDTGSAPPGTLIFESGVGTLPLSARTIRVNPALLSDPRMIPVAGTPGAPGNNDILRQIGQLVNSHTFPSSQTDREYYSQTLTRLANIGADSANGQAVTDATVTQISRQRESTVGVNMDEEAVNMIKFQRAFEAAARMISTTSDIMKTIVNLGA